MAACVLVCQNRQFHQPLSMGPHVDKLLTVGADRDGIGKAKLPLQLVMALAASKHFIDILRASSTTRISSSILWACV